MAMAMASRNGQCQFFLNKKKRYCRFKPKPNATYCPEHACIMGIVEDRKRIPCPLNPNHNCYEDELKRHLKKCNITKSRQAIEKLPYYVKNVNRGDVDDCKSDTISSMGSVKDLTSERLGLMIKKVERLYSDVVEDIEKLYLEHTRIKEEIVGNLNQDFTKAFGDQAVLRKEMLQQASLVGQLEDLGFLSNGHHYVELGAGKGKLSHWIHKASADCDDNSFLLVERSSVRYKVDPYHKNDRGKAENFQRIKIDIQDFYLGKAPGIQKKNSLMVIGKHLCGGATDLGIRCAVNTLHPSPHHHQNPSMSQTDDSRVGPPESGSAKLLGSDEIKCVDREPLTVLEEKISDKRGVAGNETSQSPEHRMPSTDEADDMRNVGQCDKESEMEPPSKVARLETEEHQTCKLKGIMIALCCHHRCSWDTYVGQEFMKKHGVNEEEFDLLTRLSSWATCARTRIRGKTSTKKSSSDNDTVEDKLDEVKNSSTTEFSGQRGPEAIDTKEEEEEDEGHGVEDLIGADVRDCVHLRQSLSVAEREVIGRKAKRIIDQGRIEYLQSKNLSCCLREYISDEVTPENVVLVATALEEVSS